MLARCGMGMGTLALGSLLGTGMASPARGQGGEINPLAVKAPPFAPRAKRVIHLFMNGGPSHVDTFDPKPRLTEYHGKPIPLDLRTERKTGAAWKSPYAFKKYGKSGLEVSEIFPKVGEHADELCVI